MMIHFLQKIGKPSIGNKLVSFNFQHGSLLLLPLLALLFILNSTVPALASPVQSKLLPFVQKSLMLDVSATEGIVATVGEQGFVLLSSDAGKNWKQVEVPAEIGLTGVYFLDAKSGWAVGYDHVIIRTRDGGENWDLVYEDIKADSPLLDVFFLDANTGFAIGTYGAFLTTTDGGENWEAGMLNLVVPPSVEGQEVTDKDPDFEDEEPFADYHLNQIALAKNGNLYIAAEQGHMYRSDDNGLSWVELESPYLGSYFGVLPLEGDSVLMYGLRGNLYRSDDSGNNWTQVKVGTKTLLAAGVIMPDDTILIGGNGGVVLVSRDNGQSFVVKRIPERKGISSLTLADDNSLILVGAFGVKRMSGSDLDVFK